MTQLHTLGSFFKIPSKCESLRGGPDIYFVKIPQGIPVWDSSVLLMLKAFLILPRDLTPSLMSPQFSFSWLFLGKVQAYLWPIPKRTS